MSCYSIGQSKRSTEWKDGSHLVPGPGAYDPKTFQPTPPKYTLSSRTYLKDARLTAPGPGAYEYKASLDVPSSKFFHIT